MPEWNTSNANLIDAVFWTQGADEVDTAIGRLHTEAPLDYFEEVQIEGSPLPVGPGYWAVTRHDDIVTVSRSPEIYSSATGIVVTDLPPEFLEFFSSMIAMDNPRHARLRRLVSKGFTPKMLGRLEGSVQRIAASIVDGVAERGECDFVVDVASALPLKIVCDLMGVPESQYDFVIERTNVILGLSDPEFRVEDVDIITQLLTAGGELAQLMSDVAGTKRGKDSDDLTSVLVNAEFEDDQLSASDLASFFILLVVAGNETTRNAISWGLDYLTRYPDQRRIWAADFEGVAPTAVEEIVRLASPVTYMRRTVIEDTTLAGRDLAAGDKVCMFYLAANRDPDVFADPFVFDVRRDPNPHLGFGGPGPHYCLGAHLARREITVMFRELFNRLPDIHTVGEPDVLQASFIHGVKHLAAEFTPAASIGPA